MSQKLECCGVEPQLVEEFKHVRSCWCCFLMLGVLLVLCGTAAIVIPPLNFTLITAIVLGIALMVARHCDHRQCVLDRQMERNAVTPACGHTLLWS